MKYMVLMYSDPAATEAMSASDRAEVAHRHEVLHQDLAGSGEMLTGAGLAYPRDTMPSGGVWMDLPRRRGRSPGRPGQLTACYMIDRAGPDRARAIAERILDFHVTAVEVRPIHDSFGMGGT